MIARNQVSLTAMALGLGLTAALLATPAGAFAFASAIETQYEVRVTAARVNVRARPTTSSDVLFRVTRGDTLHLVEKAEDWYLVESPDKKRGYIYGTLVELVQLAPSGSSRRPSASGAAVPAEKDQIAEAQERSWAEKKRRSGLYKLVGGGAGVASGLVVMGSSKPAGIGLVGAGGYFLWDGYKDRQEAQRRFRWSLLLQVNRDVKGVAYHMSW